MMVQKRGVFSLMVTESGRNESEDKAPPTVRAQLASPPKGPVRRLLSVWPILSAENRVSALVAFEEAYDNDPDRAFGSEYASDAALFWIVHRFRGSRRWRCADPVLDRLHSKLMTATRTQSPFAEARARLGLGLDDADISTKDLLAEIRRQKEHYNALMVRQNAAFTLFLGWLRGHADRYSPLVASLFLYLFFKKTAAAEAGRTLWRSQGRRVSAVVIGCSLFGWCVVSKPRSSATQSAIGAIDGGAETGDLVSRSPVEPDAAIPALLGTDAAELHVGSIDVRGEPLFHLLALSQNVRMQRVAGEAPRILRQGWRDMEGIGVVSAEYVDQWRRVDALDARASAQAIAGDFEGALTTYLEGVKARGATRPWPPFTTMNDIDSFILTALGRHSNKYPIPASSPFDGPAVLGMTQYELGLGNEAAGEITEALAWYGRAIWRQVVMPVAVQDEGAEHLAASRWGFLLNLSAMYEDAAQRAGRLAARLVQERRAAMSNGLVVWYESGLLRATWLTPVLPAACDAGDPGADRPSYHFGQVWRVSTEFDGVIDEQTSVAYLNGVLVRRAVVLPSTSRRARLVVHFQLDGVYTGPCADVVVAAEVCMSGSGEFMPLAACPG